MNKQREPRQVTTVGNKQNVQVRLNQRCLPAAAAGPPEKKVGHGCTEDGAESELTERTAGSQLISQSLYSCTEQYSPHTRRKNTIRLERTKLLLDEKRNQSVFRGRGT